MRLFLRNLAVARTVSRRQLLSRSRKLARRLIYPVRASVLSGRRRAPDLSSLLSAEAAGRVAGAGGLLEHFRQRQYPTWFPGPEVAAAEPAAFPAEARICLSAAENVCLGKYRFLSVDGPRTGNPPDWLASPGGRKEWTYLLNRFHYLLDVARAYRYTRRDQFVTTGMDLVIDWIRANPEGHPVTWESVSCGWRIENWFAALLHFLPSDLLTEEWTVAVISSISQQADYLRRHIEYDLAGNHLLFEAKGLIVAGLMLPELRRAGLWLSEGLNLLMREMSRQVLPDGGHGELAPHYHVEITLLLTEVAVLLELNRVHLPSSLIETLRKMYRFLLWITRPDGDIPMLGDSVRDDPIVARRLLGLGRVYLDEAQLGVLAQGGAQIDRLLGLGSSERVQTSIAHPPSSGSRLFASSGYAVVRSGWSRTSDYLVWDCGPFGMRAGPGHGHADQLSFELVVGGATAVLDPGVYQYEAGRWRDYFRGVTAHNTLRVGGRNPCVMWSAYRVMHAPRTRLLGWFALPGLHLGTAEHDGYWRDMGVTHRRTIICMNDHTWLIADWLYPDRDNLSWEAFLHFAPGARLSCEGSHFGAEIPGSRAIRGQFLGIAGSCLVARGDNEPIQGWVSYAFGEKREAPVLIVTGSGAPAPVVTALDSHTRPREWAVEHAGKGALLLRRVAGREETIVGLRGPTSPRLSQGGIETDARVLIVTRTNGALDRVLMVGGRYLTWETRHLLQAHDRAGFIDWRRERSRAVLDASPGTTVRFGFDGIITRAGEGGVRGEGPSEFRFIRGAGAEAFSLGECEV